MPISNQCSNVAPVNTVLLLTVTTFFWESGKKTADTQALTEEE